MDNTEIEVVYPLLRCPGHPGAILLDICADLPFSMLELSRRLEISSWELGELLAERLTVSPSLADKLGVHVGGQADLWLRLQAAYDEWNSSQA